MKVLIIGLGSIAKKHIKVLREIDAQVKLVALRSSSDSKIFEGITNIYNTESIPQEAPDFIIVSNPPLCHFDTLLKIKEYAVPLFIEKPLFSKIGSAEENLIHEIQSKDIPNYVACNLRFLHALRIIREKIREERINEVNVYCGSYLPEWRPGVDFRNNYSANKNMGGGVHIDLIHELDYVYWIFGAPLCVHSLFANKSSLHISSYDYALYVWVYENFTVSIILNYFRKDTKRSLEIVCESGTYEIDLLKNRIFYNHNLIFESNQRGIDTYKDQMLFFIDNFLNNQTCNFNSVEEAYHILQLCLKV